MLSSTVADALTFYNEEDTMETRVFIRHMDYFFDCLNVRNDTEGIKKRKPQREAYIHPWDARFKVVFTFFYPAVLYPYIVCA